MYKVGDKIYSLRRELGLSQTEFGKLIGVTRQTISKWESHRLDVVEKRLNQIINRFNLHNEYFSDIREVIITEEYFQSLSDNIDVVACDETEEEIKPTEEPKRSLGIKNTVAMLIVLLAVCVVAAVLGDMLTPPHAGIETAISRSYNFSFASLSWIIFSSIFIVLAIIAVILIRAIKKKKKSQSGSLKEKIIKAPSITICLIVSLILTGSAFCFLCGGKANAETDGEISQVKTHGIMTQLSIEIGDGRGIVWARVHNDFTFGVSTIEVKIELYSSLTYQEDHNLMVLENCNYIDDLNIRKTLETSAMTDGVKKYWRARIVYKFDDKDWVSKETRTWLFDVDGRAIINPTGN